MSIRRSSLQRLEGDFEGASWIENHFDVWYNAKPMRKKSPRKRIFVVEDDPIIRDYLDTILKEFRYKVSGGKFAALFDGTEKVLSIDFFPWNNLAVTSGAK